MVKFIKQLVRFVIALIGRHRWPINSPQLVILAYHRILPENDPRYKFEQPTMVVTPETLDKNLKWVTKHFKIISLSSWLSMCTSKTPPKGKYCAITFDDGWLDNLEYALPVLQKYSAPATIFCVSKMLGNKTNFWPGRVTKLVFEASKVSSLDSYIKAKPFEWLRNACENEDVNWSRPTKNDFNIIVECLKIYKDLDIHSFIDITKQQLDYEYIEERQVLNIGELQSMHSSNLIEFGSHTNNHIRFENDTSEEILLSEIKDSKNNLVGKLGCEINTFCYPNGYHPLKSVEIARKYYLGACTLEKGWNNQYTDFAKLRRISLHEEVAACKNHFMSCLSGWI